MDVQHGRRLEQFRIGSRERFRSDRRSREVRGLRLLGLSNNALGRGCRWRDGNLPRRTPARGGNEIGKREDQMAAQARVQSGPRAAYFGSVLRGSKSPSLPLRAGEKVRNWVAPAASARVA